jgi:ATP-dependent DNA helicase RecG
MKAAHRPPSGELRDLLEQVARGEDSVRQFKVDVKNPDSLAAEMVAFSNSEGGRMFIGVADDGSVPGLTAPDVRRINQLIANVASQHVHSPIDVRTANMPVDNGRIVILLDIPKGIDKPYFDKNGIIWLRVGSDKRRINSKEELRRFFQFSPQFHADEMPTRADASHLDKLRFRDFLKREYNRDYPESPDELALLLKNLNLAVEDGHLNLAGVLFFAEHPDWIVPQFVVKAARFPGNSIAAVEYIDSEDFAGPLDKIFADSLAFIMRNLHKVQEEGANVNFPGVPEVPKDVFVELLVNALIHRDYLVDAAIRLLIFDNRIELISPGHLPDNLTVEKMQSGNSNIRNPVLMSFAAKKILPYHGLGSGVKRALEKWPDIDFKDDREGCLFVATVHRPAAGIREHWPIEPYSMAGELRENGPKDGLYGVPMERHGIIRREYGTIRQENGTMKHDAGTFVRKNGARHESLVLAACREKPAVTVDELTVRLGVSVRTVKRVLASLQEQRRLRRVGGRKFGYWEALP